MEIERVRRGGLEDGNREREAWKLEIKIEKEDGDRERGVEDGDRNRERRGGWR